jgi:hypothetical protein
MAFISDWASAVEVDDGAETYRDHLSYTAPAGETPESYYHIITTARSHYPGLTKAAAEAGVTALSDPPGVNASYRRENAGGAFQVDKITVTTGAWVEIEPPA